VPVCLGVPVGLTSWTSSPIAGDARAARTAGTSLLSEVIAIHCTTAFIVSPGLWDRDVIVSIHCGKSRSLGQCYIDESVDRGPISEYRHVAPIKETRFVSPSLLGLL